jgi:phosphoribosyl 1,2-cyclic phosphodiesterase
MFVRILASSSAGNCTLVLSGRTALLIDCGLGPERMRSLLQEAGVGLGDLSGVLVTHTHSDHLHRGMVGALRKSGVPLVCALPVANAIGGQMDLFGGPELPAIRVLPDTSVRIGTLEVEHFSVPHDAPGGCYGFLVHRTGSHATRSLALATDIGHVEPDLPGWLSTADLAIVESNHDLAMLMQSGRPPWLIQRIRTKGHLSNDESAGLLREALVYPGSKIRQVVLAHLSEECNRPRIALRTARQAVGEVKRGEVRIESAPGRVPMTGIEL